MPTVPIQWADNTKELISNLRQGLNQIDATRAAADKMVRSLSGENLLRAAGTYAAAVDKIGGAAKLTEENQARVNAVMQKAVAQLEASGRGASDLANHYRDLAKQTQAVKDTKIEAWFGDLSKNVTAMAAGFVSAQAVIGGVTTAYRTLVGFLKDSVKSATDAEAAQSKLTQALKTQGTFSDELVGQYNELSTSIQQTTSFSDDQATSMQALLVQVGGVMPSAMQSALKASTDLAAGLGVDLETATTLVAKAAAGHTETLGKYGITVSEAELKSKGFEAVLEAINRQFGGQASAQVDTYAGKVSQLANAWDNLQEAVGRKIILDPLVLAAINKLTQDSQGAADEIDSAKESTQSWWDTAAKAQEVINPLAQAIDYIGQAWAEAEQQAALYNATQSALARGKNAVDSMAAAAADQTAQRITAAGMAESARLSDEDAKKRKALTDAIEQHTKAIQEQAQALSGLKTAKELADLTEAWGKLTPAEQANELAVQRLLDAYEPLRAQLDPSALPSGFEALRTAAAGAEDIMRSRAIPTFQAVNITLEQMLNLARGLTSQGNLIGTGISQQLAQVKANADATRKALEEGKIVLPMPAQTGIGGLDKTIGDGIDTAIQNAFKDAFDSLPQLFEQAFTGGGGIQGAMQALGTKLGAALGQALVKAIKDTTDGSSVNADAAKGGAALGLVSGTAIGVRGGSAASQFGSLSGAGVGAGVAAGIAAPGGLTAGAIGAGLTAGAVTFGVGAAVIGGIMLIRHLYQSEAEKLGKDIGRDIGVQIAPEMLKAWEADSKQFGRQATEILHIGDLIQAAGGLNTGNLDLFTGKLHDVFSMIETHQLSIAQGTQVIDDNWQAFVDASTDGAGRISSKLKEIIALDERFGTNSKAIAAWKQTQGGNALTGFVSSVQDGSAITDQASAQAASTRALGSYSAAVATGMSPADALKEIAPALDAIKQAYDRLGISIDDAGLKQLMLLSTVQQQAGPAISAIAGINQEMIALDNLGLETKEMFQAQQTSAAQYYRQIQSSVAAAGGTTKDALSQMQTYLHQAAQEAQNLGIPLDDNTQMLIDQSKELGIWKDAGKSSTEILTDGMNDLVKAVKDLINQLRGIPSEVTTDINVNEHHNVDGDGPTFGKNNDGSDDMDGDPATPWRTGGGPVMDSRFRPIDFTPIGTDVIPSLLGRDEMVLNAEQQRIVGTLMAQGVPAASSGAGGGDVTVNMDVMVNASGADLQDIDRFIPKFKDAMRRDTGGLRTDIEATARKAVGS